MVPVGRVPPHNLQAEESLLGAMLLSGSSAAAICTLVVNPLTLGPLYYAAYKIGSWELRHDAMVDPGAAARVSGELSRLLFWIHQASGPIALGVVRPFLHAFVERFNFREGGGGQLVFLGALAVMPADRRSGNSTP